VFLLLNQYQLGYAAFDIHRAIEVLREQYGAPEFRSLAGEDYVVSGYTVWTPQGEREIVTKGAVARFSNGQCIEVIQPVSGATAIYDEFIRPDEPMRLHHVAMRVEASDFDETLAQHERHGRRVVIRGDMRTVRFAYVDTRATLGHYVEYVSAPPEHFTS
jgi:hypothetical protein